MEVVALAAAGNGAERGFWRVAAGDFGAMHLVVVQQVLGQVVVEVVGGVGEGGEDQHLAVAGVDRRGELAGDLGFQVLQLGVVARGDLGHFGQQLVDEE